MKHNVIDKINKKESKIAIIGLGYVGLPLAKEYLKVGFNILGFDVDRKTRK